MMAAFRSIKNEVYRIQQKSEVATDFNRHVAEMN